MNKIAAVVGKEVDVCFVDREDGKCAARGSPLLRRAMSWRIFLSFRGTFRGTS